MACQIGKKIGARVIAIAGSQEKVDWLEKELGVDKALNYKSPTFREDFVKAVGYLDVYFDNVGGEMLNYMLTRMNKGARIALCGVYSPSFSSYMRRSSIPTRSRSGHELLEAILTSKTSASIYTHD